MANAYLDGIKLKAGAGSMRTLLLWVLLIVLFLAIWQFLSPSGSDGTRAQRRSARHRTAVREEAVRPPASESLWIEALPVGSVLIVFPLIMVFLVRAQSRRGAALRSAEAMLLEDDIEGAVTKVRATLTRVPPGFARFQALVLLGRCAENRGDHREAAEIYAKAAGSLPSTIGSTLLKNQVVPVANARCAFALAAEGRLDEAEALLAVPQPHEALPGTHALMVRARAIVDSKRGRYRQLLDGLTAAHATIRQSLPLRDRLLLRTVAAHARVSIDDRHRAAQATPTVVDPQLGAWIARIVPHAAGAIEGAS